MYLPETIVFRRFPWTPTLGTAPSSMGVGGDVLQERWSVRPDQDHRVLELREELLGALALLRLLGRRAAAVLVRVAQS